MNASRAMILALLAGLHALAPAAFALPPQRSSLPASNAAPTTRPRPEPVARVNPNLAIYKVGLYGHAVRGGVKVCRLTTFRDVNQNWRRRCALADIAVDFNGNGRTVPVQLESGDLILAIDGQPVHTMDDIAALVNSANNPAAIILTFQDVRSGNTYSGSIRAIRVR